METKSKFIGIIFVFFFGVFLFLGIKTSQRLFGDEASAPLATSDGLDVQELSHQSAEEFTLLIYVNDLSLPEPELEGVWLSRPGEDYGSMYFFPIFPSQALDGTRRDEILQGSFVLESGSVPGERFTKTLIDRNLSWSQVLLIDQFALLELEGILNRGSDEDQLQISPLLPSASYQVEQRTAAQTTQALIIQDLCAFLPLVDQNQIFNRMLDNFSGHMLRYSISAEDLSSLWREISWCHFPTLDFQQTP
jgi:hypothetical protein